MLHDICSFFPPHESIPVRSMLLSAVMDGDRGDVWLVAEWLACWTGLSYSAEGPVQIAAATLSGNSLRQTVHTHRACVHQAAKLVAALLRVAGVIAGLAESSGCLPSSL